MCVMYVCEVWVCEVKLVCVEIVRGACVRVYVCDVCVCESEAYLGSTQEIYIGSVYTNECTHIH